jgi:anti-sigma28 factor (negative regulator of flagellin synthesis)
MCVGMALTSGTRRGPQSASDFAKTAGNADLNRMARVEDLRRLVAAGRYQVQPERLALRILVRSLKR